MLAHKREKDEEKKIGFCFSLLQKKTGEKKDKSEWRRMGELSGIIKTEPETGGRQDETASQG